MDEHDDPFRPSWVMGRSARWHTPRGQALLAEDAIADERVGEHAGLALGNVSAALNGGKSPLDAAVTLVRLLRIAWRNYRRPPGRDLRPGRVGVSWPSCEPASSAPRPRRSRRRPGG